MSISLIIVIVAALAFDFYNGMRDSSNIVATMVSSRAFQPRVALGLTALAEFSGPFIFGVAVANTIGNGIVAPESVNMLVIMAALFAAILWNLITAYFGLPSSSSHALVGGLIGAVMVATGWQVIELSGLEKVLIALFTSPILGFLFGYIISKVIVFFCLGVSPKANWFFKRGQIITSISLALSHGTNDAQKTMGIITLALVSSGFLKEFKVPIYVIIACATMIALGTAFGEWKLIRTLGGKFYKIRPVDGFNAQLASAAVIIGSSLLGGPVSTTHVASSSILGVGAAQRINKVRWGVAGDIVAAWLLTIPATALVAAGIYWVLIHLPL